ncbi:MAG TPA: hypothetical protein VMI54_18320 [Polyangiaceae bacterium]|nr:hypothetical protein [Polyangiaceae bacterium]
MFRGVRVPDHAQAVFELHGKQPDEALVYGGYGLNLDPKHQTKGRYDLLGMTDFELGYSDDQKTHWVEERFAWNGREYRYESRRRVEDDGH